MKGWTLETEEVEDAAENVAGSTDDADEGGDEDRENEGSGVEVGESPEERRWQLHHGDCRDFLRTLDEGSIDAVVTDPPYGLSDEPDPEAVLGAWLRGEEYHHKKKGFMGREWDSLVPGPKLWREVFRVLRPGGYLLAFAGTRTWDLMSMALRLAGFQNRDTMRHDFGVPALGWNFGTGFPKSRALLKPAWEPILIFRKPGPLREFRIDECRVGKEIGGLSKYGEARPVAGRWPANVVFSHSELCERVGERRVKNESGDIKNAGPRENAVVNQTLYGTDNRDRGNWTRYGDADGMETIEEWRCAEGCPVRLLGEQSGTRKDGVAVQRNRDGQVHNRVYGPQVKRPSPDVGYGGEGTAARFFRQFPADAPATIWCPKASRREREAGCEDLATKVVSRYGEQGQGPLEKQTPRREVAQGNHHTTVKPVALMRHLVRLATPAGGVVLDPFTGSGTTGCAALLEGLRFVGCERESDYAEIARARLAHYAAQRTK